jgi:uncharacterized protein YyaL (SSP411 family)
MDTPVAVAAPGPAVLGKSLRKILEQRHRDAYDTQRGSLKLAQKYLDRDSVEYALVRAAAGDSLERRRARQTLDAAQALLDPVWGGLYQYSTGGDWQHPHFEKIMRTQAGALRLYAQAYALWKRPQDRAAAQSIYGYLMSTLRDPQTGAFHGTQDADVVPGEKAAAYFALPDAARRRIGVPRIDPNFYAQENGMAIEALVAWHEASGDADALAAALRAADWVLKSRACDGQAAGLFRHGEEPVCGQYLGDTLSMGRAALALWRVTAEDRWRDVALAAGKAIPEHFSRDEGGYRTAQLQGAPLPPPPVAEENISAACFYAALGDSTGDASLSAQAQRAMRWLLVPAVALGSLTEPGILLAADALGNH